MSVCRGCCVLSGSAFCDCPISLPEESCRVCVCVCVCVCVSECDFETLTVRRAKPTRVVSMGRRGGERNKWGVTMMTVLCISFAHCGIVSISVVSDYE
jgi:hypothetical protein